MVDGERSKWTTNTALRKIKLIVDSRSIRYKHRSCNRLSQVSINSTCTNPILLSHRRTSQMQV